LINRNSKFCSRIDGALFAEVLDLTYVELAAEWIGGQYDANDILEAHFGEHHHADFTALWSQPGIDLLRPLRSDKYVGSQWSPDDKRCHTSK